MMKMIVVMTIRTVAVLQHRVEIVETKMWGTRFKWEWEEFSLCFLKPLISQRDRHKLDN